MSDADPVRVSPTGERVVEVTGADRLTFLDDTTTQALRDATPGTATAALVLDANGLPLLALEVAVLADRVLLVVPDAAAVDGIMALLAGRTFLSDVRFEPLDLTVMLVHGAADAVAAATTSAGVAAPAGAAHERGPVVAVDARHGALRLVGPAEALGGLAAALRHAGAQDGTALDVSCWRVRVGEPTWGREIVAPHLPEEAGLLPTHVHLAKGCYPGQEAVARMWMLGRPRRRLARVRVEGDVAAGWSVGSGRDEVRVTAVDPATHVGLAFVPGDADVGFRMADGGSVEVIALIGADRIPPGHDPAMRRRRDRPRGAADA